MCNRRLEGFCFGIGYISLSMVKVVPRLESGKIADKSLK